MINNVQTVKSLRSVIWYMLNDEAHDDSGQRYLMAAGEGCTPANALSVMRRRLNQAGKLDQGVQGFSWVHSFDLTEFDPTNPDDVEQAMTLTREASRRRSAGDPPRDGNVTTKLFVAQADGKAGRLHIHEVELNLLNLDVEYTTTVGSRTGGVEGERITKTAQAGRALPPEFRDVFRGRRIANQVYLEHTGRSNDDLMLERGKGQLTWDETRRELINYYVSQPEVQAGGLTVLEARMAAEGHETKRRESKRGKKSAPAWITTSSTGAPMQARRWASLGEGFSEEALMRRLATPEPVREYPKNIRLTKTQSDRLHKEARIEAESVRVAQTITPLPEVSPQDQAMALFNALQEKDDKEADALAARQIAFLDQIRHQPAPQPALTATTPEPTQTVRHVVQQAAEKTVEQTTQAEAWIENIREYFDADEGMFEHFMNIAEDDPDAKAFAQHCLDTLATERARVEELLEHDQSKAFEVFDDYQEVSEELNDLDKRQEWIHNRRRTRQAQNRRAVEQTQQQTVEQEEATPIMPVPMPSIEKRIDTYTDRQKARQRMKEAKTEAEKRKPSARD